MNSKIHIGLPLYFSILQKTSWKWHNKYPSSMKMSWVDVVAEMISLNRFGGWAIKSGEDEGGAEFKAITRNI